MHLWEIYKGKDYNIVPTLDRIQKATEYIGLSNPSFLSFQIGGTNGKGSTCAFLESLLRHHGYKTGWFVSPHLFQETERWRVNAQNMPEDRLNYYVKEFKPIFEKFNLTYFEACTLIAMKYFQDEQVDFAVFEVGMGGRWDATKVCRPHVCPLRTPVGGGPAPGQGGRQAGGDGSGGGPARAGPLHGSPPPGRKAIVSGPLTSAAA